MFPQYLQMHVLSSRSLAERVLETKLGFRAAASTSPTETLCVDFGTPFTAARFAANLALLSTRISDVWNCSSPSSHVDAGGVPSIV